LKQNDQGKNMRRTIFVSSTFIDLQIHRKAVWEMLGSFDVAIRGMEQFGARKESPLETCLVELEQSDIYIGIIAFRHGSIEPTHGKSYTQIEYERAREIGKDVRIYLVDEENARFAVKFIDQGQQREKLEAFKKTLRELHTVDTFVDEKDLVKKLKRDLAEVLSPINATVEDPDEISKSKSTLAQFFLLPKSVAGTEIRLQVCVAGPGYPLSRQACRAFNLEFGATIGIPVTILSPQSAQPDAKFDLFLSQGHATSVLPLTRGDIIEGYAKLQFSETEIDQLKARFRTVSEYMGLNSIHKALLPDIVTHQADSAIAIELTRLITYKRSPISPTTVQHVS
jgi:hypothetical protein